MLIEATDTWLERKLLKSLKSSPYFTVMADQCQDISSQEELSICFQWLIDGCPEEHYLTTLHVKSTDAEIITAAITAYISEKNLDYLLGKDTMEHQLSQEANLEFKEESVFMQNMLFTSTVLATSCNWPLFKQQSVLTPLRRCLVP